MLSQDLYQDHIHIPEVISAMQGKLQAFNKYDFIYLDSASSQKIYYLQEGLLRLGTYTETGKEVTFCLVQEGAVVGNFSLQAQQGRPFAQAYSEVKLIAYAEWEIKSLFQSDLSSSFEVFKLMGEHLRTMEEQFKMLAYCDVHERIIRFVLYLADLYGYRHQRVTFIPHHFTHEDISRVIHTSRQTVTVSLRELQRQGYLSYRRGEFRIYRYEELMKLVNKCMN
ncbi:CRP/FNR family cyclic AMP-dependent transcriptional regulator [Catalinimonas alkaloidigena]|uniref:Crp/Fnr family transcriptional regulator n=1 Tax=Catalinimonas alkaloidigena TaxID=1075417 RepID=UPI002404D339|nr:Crp/Fnr family transcriptional regulator [Catalinimonas alkaloidigena]MDF9797120.1 CRP/FNR family cyclic AMP-dependent transcriptional regulator [Catalinimonas alkaloidigena]